jgi:hypothetical protein
MLFASRWREYQSYVSGLLGNYKFDSEFFKREAAKYE